MPVDLITLTEPRSAAAEAYRILRTNLMFSNVDAQFSTIALTSASNEDGKSSALANLAVTLAQGGHQTLIVDADLRRPAQHILWQVNNAQGITSMLLEANAFENPPLQSTEVENLKLLPSGPLPANPADILASQKMDAIIARLSKDADFVLFDAPPVLATTDASVLSLKLDGILLVVKAGVTRRDHTIRAKEQLERVQAHLIGVVLTNAPHVKSRYG